MTTHYVVLCANWPTYQIFQTKLYEKSTTFSSIKNIAGFRIQKNILEFWKISHKRILFSSWLVQRLIFSANLKFTILLFQLISNGHSFWEWRGNHQHEKPGTETTVNFLYQYIMKEMAPVDDKFEEIELVLRLKLKVSTAFCKKIGTESNFTEIWTSHYTASEMGGGTKSEIWFQIHILHTKNPLYTTPFN